MIIFGISYFIGIVFYIFADLTNDMLMVTPEGQDEGYYENFIDYFSINNLNSFEKGLVMVYYAFTSLSTVGFGDYNPRSDSERLFIALILLFGVLIFSYAMGNFREMMDSIKTQNSTFDEGDNLSKFFGLLHNFN
jgi:hypothetical protein